MSKLVTVKGTTVGALRSLVKEADKRELKNSFPVSCINWDDARRVEGVQRLGFELENEDVNQTSIELEPERNLIARVHLLDKFVNIPVKTVRMHDGVLHITKPDDHRVYFAAGQWISVDVIEDDKFISEWYGR